MNKKKQRTLSTRCQSVASGSASIIKKRYSARSYQLIVYKISQGSWARSTFTFFISVRIELETRRQRLHWLHPFQVLFSISLLDGPVRFCYINLLKKIWVDLTDQSSIIYWSNPGDRLHNWFVELFKVFYGVVTSSPLYSPFNVSGTFDPPYAWKLSYHCLRYDRGSHKRQEQM